MASLNDPEYVRNELHAEEAIAHLIEFFRDGPRSQALLRAVHGYIQALEDTIWSTYTAFDLNTAVGDQLDKLGLQVGELRNDLSDTDYRNMIAVRIMVNNSQGGLEELIDIALALSPGADVFAQEQYPASVRMILDSYGTFGMRPMYSYLLQAKPAGVRLLLISGTPSVGAVDGTPLGGTIGAVDGTPAGFIIGAGT